MISIEFRFPAGRYHATPWNRQVNEGIVEWPPNPWRIIRALISTYHTKMRDEYSLDVLEGLVQKLCSYPEYYLPEAAIGHTRHYMPLYKPGESAMIFDTYVCLGKEECLYISWPETNLDDDQKELLSSLLEMISYLGRAESWVLAKLVGSAPEPNCTVIGDNGPKKDFELIDVLIPQTSEEYTTWVKEWKDNHSNTKRNRVPDNLLDAICLETPVLKKNGWSQPLGSKWIQYERSSDCFDIKPEYRSRSSEEERSTVARFQIASQAPPRLTDAISVADRVHKSLIKISDGSAVFTGCDAKGKPLDNHEHTFIICESNLALGRGRRGEITHITLYCPMGFGRKERQSLDNLRKVWGHGGHDIQLVLLGVGEVHNFGGFGMSAGKCPVLATSRKWVSRTPFVPTRHPKFTRAGKPKLDEDGLQKGSPEHDLRRLIHEMGFPEPVSCKPMDSTNLAGHKTRWLEFTRERYGGEGKKSTDLGFGFELEFPEPVQGPLAFGYGAHFGLGCFVGVDDETDSGEEELGA